VSSTAPDLFVIHQGHAVPVPESGLVLTIVDLAPGVLVIPLESPAPPLKHSCELVQIQTLGQGPRGMLRTGIVWMVRRVDE
jgi:hypothetical protein